MDSQLQLNSEMILVMIMIAVAVFLFVVEWVRVDVVGIIMMVTLPLLGLVSPNEAFIGLSSNAVVSIIAVIIIGAGLDKTGIVNKTIAPVIKIAGDSVSRITVSLSVTISIVSSFMQNIGAAALFLPAIKRVSKRMEVPVSRLLMPIGFSAILGGTVTMIGSSPLILLNDLLKPHELEPFGLFSVTPIGIALVVAGIAYFLILGRFVLPHGEELKDYGEKEKAKDIKNWYRFLGEPYELSVPGNYNPDGGGLTISKIRHNYLVSIVVLAGRDKKQVLAPSRMAKLEAGQHLGVYGTKENVEKLASEQGLKVKKALNIFSDLLSPSMTGTVEAVVGHHSEMVGKSLKDIHIRKQYQVTPLAIYRGNEVFKSNLSEITLQSGDAILLHGAWERFQILQKNRDFIFTTQIDYEVMRPEKALFAILGFATALTMVIAFNIQLSVALMTGALIVILTKVLSIDEAYRAVDWRTVFLLAGLIPLGIATEKSGTAAWIAIMVLDMLGDVSPVVLFSIIGLLATCFTLVISNVGATVLLVPLAVHMALDVGADPRMAALVVGIATSNSFILPTHQVNALYMGPGRYKSVDFIKAGSIWSVIFLIVMITMMYLFYGIGG